MQRILIKYNPLTRSVKVALEVVMCERDITLLPAYNELQAKATPIANWVYEIEKPSFKDFERWLDIVNRVEKLATQSSVEDHVARQES